MVDRFASIPARQIDKSPQPTRDKRGRSREHGRDQDGTYRAVYTVKFAKAVFVLHCFSKKSKRGIETPKEDMDIIRARLKVAEALSKEL